MSSALDGDPRSEAALNGHLADVPASRCSGSARSSLLTAVVDLQLTCVTGPIAAARRSSAAVPPTATRLSETTVVIISSIVELLRSRIGVDLAAASRLAPYLSGRRHGPKEGAPRKPRRGPAARPAPARVPAAEPGQSVLAPQSVRAISRRAGSPGVRERRRRSLALDRRRPGTPAPPPQTPTLPPCKNSSSSVADADAIARSTTLSPSV